MSQALAAPRSKARNLELARGLSSTSPSARRAGKDRPTTEPTAEGLLREMAYVFELTRRVKSALAAK